jgi:hypothetical protein
LRAASARSSNSRERRLGLQVAEPHRVRRGDVDGEIIRDIGEGGDAGGIIGDAVGALAVGAKIDADNARPGAARGEAAMQRREAAIVEAEAVDECGIGRQAEEARPGIAGLRQRRHRSGLDEAKAEAEQAVDGLAVLVEAAGHANGVGKVEPQEVASQARIGWRDVDARKRRFQHADRQLMH